MESLIGKWAVSLAVLCYSLFAFSPFAAHTGMPIMADMTMVAEHAPTFVVAQHGAMEMAEESHVHEQVSCAGALCISAQTINWDCLQHCLQAASNTGPTTTAAIPVVQIFVILAAAAAVVLLCIQRRSTAPPRSYWHKPLYLFNTVRLLE